MISVCMATYNGEKYLKEQIDSILYQLNSNDELIISDDGSTDGTIEIIEGYNDKRIKLHKNSFHNLIKNFEYALTQASGDYIFLCDQDDMWVSNKVRVVCEKLIHYDLVVTDCRVVDEQLNTMIPSFFQLRGSGEGFWKNLYRNTYLGCCMAFRRSLLKVILPFPADIAMHDIWIGLVAEKMGRVTFVPQQLVYYRRHGNNASPTGEKSRYGLKYKFWYRWVMLRNIIKRLRHSI